MNQEDLLIENSTKNNKTTNISKILDKLYEDELKENTNTVSNINSYKRLITDIVGRVKQESRLKNLCSVIPTTTPTGVVYAFGNRLTGKQDASAVATDNLKIFKLEDTTSFAEDGQISSTTGDGTVLYVDQNFVLVKIENGFFDHKQDVDNVVPFGTAKTEIINILTAAHALGSILSDYTGKYATQDGEEVKDYYQFDFKTSGIDIDCKTRFGNTGITVETLQDLVNMFKIKYRPKLISMLKDILNDVELNDVFTFQRANAYQRGDLVLANSIAINTSLKDIYFDIWNRINQSIGNIGTNTGIAGDYGVSASSRVYNAIVSYLGGDITYKDGVAYLPGNIPMTEDGYSIQDYMVVSLVGPKDNGACIFTPYSIDVMEVTNPETFEKRIKVIDRFDIVNNPLAGTENDQGKNPMMELTYVSFDNVVHEI